ncbi:uncharacterized protein [Battus philenor]|uniref:uncharacterized protein n=1 Tax=Battus philenor TaxID=42288 RepID=UPI0035CF82F6
MKFFGFLICFGILVYTTRGNPLVTDNPLILRPQSNLDIFGDTRQLIKELAERLRESAQQAITAVGNFSRGIQEEIKLYSEKVNQDIQTFEGRISDSISKLSDRFIDASGGVIKCIESNRGNAIALISQTYAKTKSCADDRVTELQNMINNLNEESVNALHYAKIVLESIENCSIEDNGYVLNVGLCLGSVALQAQRTGMIYIANSGILTARINLALSSLPAAFEICASSNILEASMGTAKIIMDIGSCSSTTIFDIHGSLTFTDPKIDASLINSQHKLKQVKFLTNLWNSVKHSAVNAWESVKNVAQHTGEKVTNWIYNVKTKAKDFNELFKKRLQYLKEEIKALIASLKVTGELTKECIQKKQEEIEEILKGILKSVSVCISESLQYLSVMEESSTILIDKTEFMANVENKLYLCLNKDDIDQCFNNVRNNIYEVLEREEEDILKYRDAKRDLTDDIIETIASCVSKGLIEASAAITNTTIQIIKCVSQG